MTSAMQAEVAGADTGIAVTTAGSTAEAAPVQLTARAGEMVQQAMAAEEMVGHGLRVGVIGGGCSGLQYLLDFAPGALPEDFAFRQHGVDVFIDPFSAAHLRGTTVDYTEGLQESGFKFNNPNIVRQCGCGSSFQT